MVRRFRILAFFLMLSQTLLFAQRRQEFKSYFKIADVPYTENKAVKENQMDIYMPKKGSRSPVIIWIHGGDWISGDKKDVDKRPEYFAAKGYIFIAVNYRLYPRANHATQIQDLANAIVWVNENIIHYSGDKDKVFLIGHETGANMAMMVMAQEKYLKNASGSREMIKGVVTFEGEGFDIPAVLPDQGHKFQDACEVVIGKSKRQWIEASPVTHLKNETFKTPVLIVYAGTKTNTETEAKLLVKKLADEKITYKVAAYPDESGNSILRNVGKEEVKVTDDIMTFFYECMRSS